MYSGVLQAKTIQIEEIYRAMFWADIALILFSIGCYLAHKIKIAKKENIKLNKNKVILLSSLFVIVGTPLYLLTRDSGNTIENFNNFALIMSMWPVLALSLLIYYFGFKWYLLIPTILFLSGFALQGYHRFMVILPALFLIMTYLSKNNLKWPNIKIIGILLLMLMMFPQLKYIGQAFQQNDIESLKENIVKSFILEKEKSPEGFLDQFAGALSLIDESNKIYYGATYSSALTIFIPRVFWSNKPGLADHVVALGTVDRPYDKEGRIITYLGEAYINFKYIGFFIVPLILGFVLTVCYRKYFVINLIGLQSYVYMVAIITFIQAFRDGLVALAVFLILQNLLMVLIYLIHKFEWGKPL
jgi:oligosaccharide repeat unit polymerase